MESLTRAPSAHNGGGKIWTQVSLTLAQECAAPLWLDWNQRRGTLPPFPPRTPSASLFTCFPFFCCSNRCIITPRGCYNLQFFNCQLGLAFFL